MSLLALDPATITGWCTSTSSGIWNCTPKSYESAGMKLIKFKSSLHELITKERIRFVVYEKPGGRFYNGVRSHSNFEGVLIAYCEERDIDYKGYSAKEIKKFATGKGNCNKEKMIEAAQKYGIDIIDDNHADALHLFYLAKKEFPL